MVGVFFVVVTPKQELEKAHKIIEEYQNENKKHYHDNRPNTCIQTKFYG